MNNVSSHTSLSWVKLLTMDVFIFGMAYLLPALSHLLPIPLYYLDPMKILLFSAWILSRNSYNAIFMAITIPLFSMWVTGHPTFFKSMLISVELVTMITLFLYLTKKKIAVWTGILISIVIAKMVYYFLKFISLDVGWMEGSFMSTPLWIQGCISLFLTLVLSLMALVSERKNRG